jgi:hypothetical protein
MMETSKSILQENEIGVSDYVLAHQVTELKECTKGSYNVSRDIALDSSYVDL